MGENIGNNKFVRRVSVADMPVLQFSKLLTYFEQIHGCWINHDMKLFVLVGSQ